MTDIIATLVFDSWSNSTPERRGSKPVDRHLIYEGDGIVLDLILKQNGGANCIHVGGQVLSEKAMDEQVSDRRVLMEQGKKCSATHTNALGEFSFHAVPNGSFDLCIVLDKRRFSVRGLSSQEPRMWQVVPSFAGGGD